MTSRTKILIVDSDLDVLSRIYLSLVHRNYKTEATNKPEELSERMLRFKPAVLVIAEDAFSETNIKLKIPVVILANPGSVNYRTDGEQVVLQKPVQLEELLRTIDDLVY